MGLNVLAGEEVKFSSTGCHRLMVSSIGRRGIGWWPRLTSGPMNLSMTSLAGLTTSGAHSHMRSGGSKGFMKRRRLPGWPFCNKWTMFLSRGIRSGLTLRASLNGMTLDHQLIAAESGFYLRVNWEGSPYLVSQIEHMAISHTQQLHRHPTIITGGYIHNRGTTVYIPGGNRLIFSRKINLIGPNLQRDIEGALRGRFPDLAQDNFGTGLVHLSYYLTEPVADPGWEIRLVIPVVEDDITPVILFKAVLSTYEGLGAIYVPPTLNKHTLITETGLDIVCGPQGELCACYHNGFRLGFAQLEIADLDFISCWLAEDDPLPGAPEVRNMACDSRNQPRLGSRAWARS